VSCCCENGRLNKFCVVLVIAKSVVSRSHGEVLMKVGFTSYNWKRTRFGLALSRGRADSWGQIFERVGWRQKESSIRLLASYEAVSTNIKVQELGIRLIKVINRKSLDKNKQFITTKL